MGGGVGHPKARINNVFFSRNLNQNMPYIALFLKKKEKSRSAGGSAPSPPRCHSHCLCNKTFKLHNYTVSTFILFKVNTIEKRKQINVLSLTLCRFFISQISIFLFDGHIFLAFERRGLLSLCHWLSSGQDNKQ